MTIPKSLCKDFILRPEARSNDRKTGQRKSADQECPERDRHLLAQAPHVEHILWIDIMISRVQDAMFHAMDDRTGTQEEQSFEERVGDQMEDCRNVRMDSKRRDHEAEL